MSFVKLAMMDNVCQKVTIMGYKYTKTTQGDTIVATGKLMCAPARVLSQNDSKIKFPKASIPDNAACIIGPNYDCYVRTFEPSIPSTNRDLCRVILVDR